MSTDDVLLFVGRNNTVTLTEAASSARFIKHTGYELPGAFSTPTLASPWSHPGILLENLEVTPASSRLIFPQVPATTPVANHSENEVQVPSTLTQPLQKSTISDPPDRNRVKVYTSGARSAIWREGEHFYRLKGCGNGIDNSKIHHPFPVRAVGEDHIRPPLEPGIVLQTEELERPVEIRGAMFGSTVRREQAITALVNCNLREKGMPIANSPVGFYVYQKLKLQDSNGNDTTSELCCGLYRTAGDKRLASHLLWGLELLLPFVFKVPEILPEEIQDEIPLENSTESAPNTASQPPRVRTWINNRFGNNRITGSDILDTGFAALEGDSNLLNLLSLPIESKELCISADSLPSIPESAFGEWKALWESSWKSLVDSGTNLGDILAALYWELGLETGRILRLIHDSNINWGTYEDLLGNHCNSHPNNLVVLREPQNSFLLAPLDFDLAFTRDTYRPQTCTVAEETEPLWKELIEMEKNGMRLSLGGLSLNSGVEGRADLPISIEPIRIALRDTMVLGFTAGYEGNTDPQLPQTKSLSIHFSSLIRLALIMSENIIA